MDNDRSQITKYDGNNWQRWKFQVTALLKARDVFEHVEKDILEPDNKSSKDWIEWSAKKNKAMAILTSTIADEQLDHVITCTKPAEVWATLHSINEQASSACKSGLLHEFFTYGYLEGDSMAQHVAKVKNIAARLEAVNEKQSEAAIVGRVISTLPERFGAFVSAWKMQKEEDRTLMHLMAKLNEEEMTQGQRQKTEAFSASKVKLYKKKEGGHSRPAGQSRGKCYSCGSTEHFKRDCPKAQKGKVQAQKRDKQNQSVKDESEASAWTAEIDAEALVSSIIGSWVVDCGATHHMTPRQDWFETMEPYSVNVKVANGSYATTKGRGNVRLELLYKGKWTKKLLTNVLWVPELPMSLFSSGAAADRGCETFSKGNRMTLGNNGQVIGEAFRQSGSLYQLNARVVKPECTAYACEMPAQGTKVSEELMLAHQRLNHASLKKMRKMAEIGLLNLKIPAKQRLFCEACMYGKLTRATFSRLEDKRNYLPGELIHSDVSGPHEKSVGGAKWYVLFKDESTGYRFVYFMYQKNEVLEKFKQVAAIVKAKTGRSVKYLRSDRGTEYVNEQFTTYMRENGIESQLTGRHSPEQNGRSERDNRTIVEAARASLHTLGLPKKLWSCAVDCAVYTLNRLPSEGKDTTPFEKWTGHQAKIDHLRTFGCDAYEQVPAQHRGKWEAKATKRVFIGYEGEGPNYKLYNPTSGRITISRNVKFNERESTAIDGTKRQEWPLIIEDDSEKGEQQSIAETETPDVEALPQQATLKPNLRERSALRPPERYQVHFVEAGEPMAMYCGLEEPTTYAEAMTGNAAKEWQAAVKTELEALNENNTWEACKLPPGQKVIKAKWVFKIKRNREGDPVRYKARLVAKGFLQRKGIDYRETFAPVVRYESIRAMLALVASKDYELSQFDVTSAFLYGKLDEEIFMELPEGCDTEPEGYCRLLKSLYGLKQSPRQWNKRFNDFLREYNFRSSPADPCINRGEINGEEVLLALYVDDGLLAAKSKRAINTVLANLKRNFKVTVGEADHYVGLEISRKRETKEIFVSQHAYLKKVLEKFGMKDCKESSIPFEARCVLSSNTSPTSKEEQEEISTVPYRQAVGSLMFAAVVSRPDIAFAVANVSRYLDKPGKEHWMAVKKILRYIKGTLNYGLLYGASGGSLLGYTDSDYAGCVNTRRSTSGFVFIKAGAAVSWMSQRQRIVALSTTEAEYVAAAEGAKEAIWLQKLLDSLGDKIDCVELKIDNQSAIKLVQNPEYHKRTKHIDVRFHFIREKFEEGTIAVNYVKSEEQLADILTKGLNRQVFNRLREGIGMINGEEWTRN